MSLLSVIKTAAGRLALRVGALRVAGGSTTNNTLVYDEDEDAYIPGPGGGGGGSDDQTAAEVPFTPAGTIAATNVQAAIQELDSDSRFSDDRTASGLRSATTVVSVSAATAPTSGQVLKATSSTVATWQDESGGGSDFTTPITVTIAESPNPTINVLETLTARSGDVTGPGFGAAIVFSLDNDTNLVVDAAQIDGVWEDSTTGSESSAIAFRTRVSGGSLSERWRVTSAGNLESLGAHRIVNMGDPISSADAVTLNYLGGYAAPIGGPYLTYATSAGLSAERFIGSLTVTANFESGNTTTTALRVTQIASQSVPIFEVLRNDSVVAWRVTDTFQFTSAIPGAQEWTKSSGHLGIGTSDSNSLYLLANGNVRGEVTDTYSVLDQPVLVGGTSFSSSPDASSIAEFRSTTQGVLFPRMTTTERDAISSPVAGLVIYNLTTGKLNVRTASAWEAITSA